MNSKIIITTIKNIDFKENKVIDNSIVETREYDSNMDIFLFEEIKTGRRWKGNLMHVSLYDDLIIKDEEKYKILQMLSK